MDVAAEDVIVPAGFAKDGRIVLNIDWSATRGLEMTNAIFTQQEFDSHPTNDRMTGYLPKPSNNDKNKVVPTKSPMPILEDMHAPGGLYVSMEAMMNYAQCLINKGRYKDVQIVTADSVEQMWQPLIDAPYGYGANPKYAMGWDIENEYIAHPFIPIIL